QARSHLRPRRRVARSRVPLALIVVLLGFAPALAQSAPTISLDAYDYVVGDTLTLHGENLAPHAMDRIELTSPGAGAAAGPPPGLDADDYGGGATLTLQGENLAPTAMYRIELTSPGAEAAAGPPLVSVVTADDAGALQFRAELDEPGRWALTLAGDRLDVSMNVNVRTADGERAVPAPESPTPDATQPDTTQPEPTAP